MHLHHEALQITAAGSATSLTTSASAVLSIPTAADGNKPRFVRIASNGSIHVRAGTTNSVSATTSDTLVTNNTPIIMSVGGMGYIAGIADSGTPSMQLSALDDGSVISSTTPSGS